MRHVVGKAFALVALLVCLCGLAELAQAQTKTNDQRAMVLVAQAFEDIGRGDCSTAEDKLNRALKLDSNNAWALLDLGVVYNNSGRFDQARQMFQQVADMDIKYKVTRAHFPEDVGLTLPQLAQRNLDAMGKKEGRVSAACPVMPKSRPTAQ